MTLDTHLPPELFWLASTALATAMMWLPYILDRFLRNGIGPTLGFGKDPQIIQSPWAWRAKAAHANAIENLAVFGPAVFLVHALGAATPLTALAAGAYFTARMIHYIAYLLGIPVLRTLSFLGGWAAQVLLLGGILFH